MTKISFLKRKAIAATMADSFMEDPLWVELFNGIENVREIILEHGILHVDHYSKYGELYLIDDNPLAFLIGLDTKNKKFLPEAFFDLQIIVKTLLKLKFKELLKIQKNNQRASGVLSLSWQNEFVKGRYYHIKIIAIAKEMRGSGVFRKLIAPLIERCNREQIPMILETHNPKNVPIYERFGFQVVSTRSADGMDLKQYCMIRPPRPAST